MASIWQWRKLSRDHGWTHECHTNKTQPTITITDIITSGNLPPPHSPTWWFPSLHCMFLSQTQVQQTRLLWQAHWFHIFVPYWTYHLIARLVGVIPHMVSSHQHSGHLTRSPPFQEIPVPRPPQLHLCHGDQSLFTNIPIRKSSVSCISPKNQNITSSSQLISSPAWQNSSSPLTTFLLILLTFFKLKVWTWALAWGPQLCLTFCCLCWTLLVPSVLRHYSPTLSPQHQQSLQDCLLQLDGWRSLKGLFLSCMSLWLFVYSTVLALGSPLLKSECPPPQLNRWSQWLHLICLELIPYFQTLKRSLFSL